MIGNVTNVVDKISGGWSKNAFLTEEYLLQWRTSIDRLNDSPMICKKIAMTRNPDQ